jgi:hypothetical protein
MLFNVIDSIIKNTLDNNKRFKFLPYLAFPRTGDPENMCVFVDILQMSLS